MTFTAPIPRTPFCDAVEVAAQHCRHEEALGRTPSQVIRSIGRHDSGGADWHDARRILADAWIEMLVQSSSEDPS